MVSVDMRKQKVLTNLEIAELLRSVAAAYQLKDANKNKFRIIAYERAADAIEHESSELKDLWDENKLSDVAGVGESIASHLGDLFLYGESKHFNEILKGLPEAIFKLMELPGIGIKTAYKLVTRLKIGNVNPVGDLQKAAVSGKIRSLEGFGEESEKEILEAVDKVKKRVKRYLLPYAIKISEEIIAWLKNDRNLQKVEVLGSLRRKVSTVGDIDIGIASSNPKETLKHFTEYPHKQRVIELGDVSAAIVTTGGVQVDVIALPKKSFGSLLQHFTGSKHHNIALRELALKKGLSLSERGIKKVDRSNDSKGGKILEFEDEQEFYNYLGLDWIPPELREGGNEIEAALNKKIPELIQLNEVRGDLQIHSDFDIETSHDLGTSSMQEIIESANLKGYEYLAFTEHNPSRSRHTEKQVVEILKKKKEFVEKINDNLPKGSVKKVFNSLEIDILPTGKLPVSDKALETLDFALVSIHSSFEMPKEVMTRRIIAGLNNPKVKVWAHPTGRLLQKREGVEADFREIFEFCVKNKKFVEINADPMRLDLPDYLVKIARDLGVYFTFGTDAHNIDGLNNMPWAVSVARRGWLTKQNVVNTKSIAEFEKMLE